MIGDMKVELNKAKENGYAIPAINVINPHMIKTIISVSEKLQAPVIIALAEAHLGYMGLEEAFYAYQYYANQTNVPVVLHLDHGQTIEVVKAAMDIGFTSVMIDASSHDFNTNVYMTNQIVEYSKTKNICVEAEIGHVGAGKNYETDIVTESIYTTTSDAIEFVKQTKVDSLAISIGTMHGHYQGTPKLNFDRLREINDSLTIPLVLHGGSSTGDDNLKKTIEYGIRKINVFTDIITSINNEISQYSDYFEILSGVDTGIEKCLNHYFKLFKTNKWGDLNA